MRNTFNYLVLFSLLLSLGFSSTAIAQSGNPEALTYDLVSYYEGVPKKGTKTLKSSYKGSTYYFASKANMAKFEANKQKYAPAYGGWCAYSMGIDGTKVPVNPLSYKLIKGKLYLFYKKGRVDTKSSWDKNEIALKRNADKNWASQ